MQTHTHDRPPFAVLTQGNRVILCAAHRHADHEIHSAIGDYPSVAAAVSDMQKQKAYIDWLQSNVSEDDPADNVVDLWPNERPSGG